MNKPDTLAPTLKLSNVSNAVNEEGIIARYFGGGGEKKWKPNLSQDEKPRKESWGSKMEEFIGKLKTDGWIERGIWEQARKQSMRQQKR